MTLSTLEFLDIESVITWLENKNHKVIRPFDPPLSYAVSSSTPLLKAAIVDDETTGTNFLSDKIIEIGIMVIVEYCPHTGQAYRVLEDYDDLEDPGIPIPAASTKIHGITDEMVQGKSFNDKIYTRACSRCLSHYCA